MKTLTAHTCQSLRQCLGASLASLKGFKTGALYEVMTKEQILSSTPLFDNICFFFRGIVLFHANCTEKDMYGHLEIHFYSKNS